jgi:hypothetical protein
MKAKMYSFDHHYHHVSGKCPDQAWPAPRLMDVWGLFEEAIKEFQMRLVAHKNKNQPQRLVLYLVEVALG